MGGVSGSAAGEVKNGSPSLTGGDPVIVGGWDGANFRTMKTLNDGTVVVSGTVLAITGGLTQAQLEAELDEKFGDLGQKASAGSAPVVLSTEQEAILAALPTLTQLVAELDEKLGDLGQKASAGSAPVVLSTEQEAILAALPTLAQLVAELDEKLGDLGQKASAGSAPVVLSTEQEAILAALPTLAQLVAELDEKLGDLGQKTMAGSAPVVIANDQTAIPVTGVVALSDELTRERTGQLYRYRTNYLLWSSAFDNAVWITSDVVVTPNDRLSPDGTKDMDKLVFGAVAGAHIVQISQAVVANGQVWAFSAYVFSPVETTINIQFLSYPSTVQYSSADQVMKIPAGLSRIVIQPQTVSGITTDTQIAVYFVTRNAIARTLWIWQAQFEANQTTDIIPTQAAVVTFADGQQTVVQPDASATGAITTASSFGATPFGTTSDTAIATTDGVSIPCSGFGAVGILIEGTFATGGLLFEGTVDGDEWGSVFCEQPGVGLKYFAAAAGYFRANVAGLVGFRVRAANNITGLANLLVTLNVSTPARNIQPEYADNTPHTSGDLGMYVLGVRTDSQTAQANALGKYSPLGVDGNANSWTRDAIPAAANVLSGVTTNAAGTIITIPAGRTWRGSVGGSLAVTTAAGNISAVANATVQTAGAGVTPAAGTNLNTVFAASPFALLAALVGGAGEGSVTTNNITVVAPPGNSVSLVSGVSNSTSFACWASGILQ